MSKKSQSSLLVCICDKHHSLNCILNDYGKIGKRLWRDYEIEKKRSNLVLQIIMSEFQIIFKKS